MVMWYCGNCLFHAGYANEFGEAFKSHIPRVGYFGSYLVASSYALGDASSKSLEMYQVSWLESCLIKFVVYYVVVT